MRRSAVLLLSICAAAAGQEWPPPAVAEQAAALAAIREYALNYTRRLPDYICTQETRWNLKSPGEFPNAGISEAQVTYARHQELERLITVNGKPAGNMKAQELPPVISRGEFGTLLERIFDPQIPVELKWAHWEKIGGRRMYVFSYRVPQTHGYIIREPRGEVVVAFAGVVYADFETREVLRIELQCSDFPLTSTYRELRLILNYKRTRVAGAEFLLPSDFEENFRRANEGNQQTGKLTAKFVRYRRFTTNAKIKF